MSGPPAVREAEAVRRQRSVGVLAGVMRYDAMLSAMVSGRKKQKWQVFLSHSGEDTWIARQIAREISERGAVPFLDEADVDVGAEFEEDIRAFLDQANELLVLFTPWAMERPYVWIEIGAAWLRRLPIVVVLLGLSATDFQAHPNAPVFLKKRDIIRLNDLDKYLKQLALRTRPRKKRNG